MVVVVVLCGVGRKPLPDAQRDARGYRLRPSDAASCVCPRARLAFGIPAPRFQRVTAARAPQLVWSPCRGPVLYALAAVAVLWSTRTASGLLVRGHTRRP